MREPRSWPMPWLFSLLILPLGVVVVGFNFTASISSIINLPGVIGFLFAPIVDIKFRGRTWLVLASFGSALSACLYFPLIGASHLIPMTALILVGGLITFLVAAACGGLIVKTLSESAQSKACVAVLVAAPGLLAFTIPEPLPQPSAWFQGRLPQIGKELWWVVRSPERRWSTLLLVAPGATGACPELTACGRLALRSRHIRRDVDEWSGWRSNARVGIARGRSYSRQLSGDRDYSEYASAMEQGFRSAEWKSALTKGVEALQAQRKIGYSSAYGIAEIYAELGDKEQGFEWLNNAYRERDEGLIGLKTDFILDPIRSDPRFAELVRKVGLPQ